MTNVGATARDIQALEMMPLGPISGKNFGTSISLWIITLDALEAVRVEAPKLSKQWPLISEVRILEWNSLGPRRRCERVSTGIPMGP